MFKKLIKRFASEKEPSKEETDDHIRKRVKDSLRNFGDWPHKEYNNDTKCYVLSMDEHAIAKSLDMIGLSNDEVIMTELFNDIRSVSVSVEVSNMNLERTVRRCLEEKTKYED